MALGPFSSRARSARVQGGHRAQRSSLKRRAEGFMEMQRTRPGQQFSTGMDGTWPGYGYRWWMTTAGGDDAYAAWRFGGQMIEVVPARGSVVVVVGELDYDDLVASGIEPQVLTDTIAGVVVPELP